MGDRQGSNGVLMERPAGKRRFGRSRHGWDDNIKINLQKI
jgi:hypothetical protein